MQKRDSRAGSQLQNASQPQSPVASASGAQPTLQDGPTKGGAEESCDSEEEEKIYTYKCPVFRVSNARPSRHI